MFDINPVNLYFEMELDVIHFFICSKSTLLSVKQFYRSLAFDWHAEFFINDITSRVSNVRC